MSDTIPTDVDDLAKTLQTIQPKHTLLNTSITTTITNLVWKKFTGVDLTLHKLDPNLILYVCDLVENAFTNSSVQKVDKKAQVIMVMKATIPTLTDDDIAAMDKIIEFVHSSGQVTKIEKLVEEALPLFKRVVKFFLQKS